MSRDDIGPVNVVVSTGPPHSDHLVGAQIARRLGVPFVMDLRDDWYGNPMNTSRAPWHDPVQGRLEAWAVARAARVVVISDEAVDKLTTRYPRLRGRAVSIPNGYDPADIPEPLPSHTRDDEWSPSPSSVRCVENSTSAGSSRHSMTLAGGNRCRRAFGSVGWSIAMSSQVQAPPASRTECG